MSDSLRPHGLQHARLPCPSLSPTVYSNSCPLIQWCHPTISPSVIPFSSCHQSFPSSGSFPLSRLFPSRGQNISFSISPSNKYLELISFRMDSLDLLAVQGNLKCLLRHRILKPSIFGCCRLPTTVFWPREFRGVYSPWGHKELDTTERLLLPFSFLYGPTNEWKIS